MSVDFQILPTFREPLLTASSFHSPVWRSKPRLQRITLTEKITAVFDSEKAILIDISLSGALLAHQTPRRKGERLTVRFDWRGETVQAEVEVMRTEAHRPAIAGTRPIYRSGVAFRRHLDSSEKVLRRMVTELVERALDERKSNARGIPPIAASYKTSGKIRGFLRLRLVHGVWQKVETGDPVQPSDGFTVSIDEDPSHVKLLCQTYEKLTPNDRELVRKMASLSVANPEGVPARRYDP